MTSWLMAETSNPNWFLLLYAFIGAFGLFATLQSTARLRRSTKKWEEVDRMYREIWRDGLPTTHHRANHRSGENGADT